ncbi:MAG: 3-hydroxyacyl-ACP dehydratase FabZ [Nitrosomonadales bacterium]|jgi:3-hydroxyacyl-[acyl-carrier-protein] dehydratase|nr:3-hydroxyacyl-ACP dehydratase FabZ [Nitrosomonadales bacterium]MCH9770965.1 3-hydroxyacyl-ACP dehydratase FabZ [Betaproteobacteria bacterium]MDC0976821.1 3-hydroxyacyl-ACP dehydratase FabZ [bacterium]
MTKDTSMDINQILDHLPHRYPFVLVDKVLSYELGKSIDAIKNVTINEPFFPGHFPHYPVMPGVLVVEALAQAAAILSFKTINDKPNDHSVYYFVGIDKARFKKPVIPGDQLKLNVSIERTIKGIWKYKGIAMVEDEIAAEAEIMCVLKEI